MTGSSSTSDSTARPRRRRLVVAWLALTLVAALASIGAGDRLRRAVFDSWQQLAPRNLADTNVRVVLIDNRSIELLGPWPWPRYYLARLTEKLAARGASVIAFDILFPEPDRMQPQSFAALYPELSPAAAAEIGQLASLDEAFGAVIGQAPVILGHAGVAEAPQSQPPLADSPVTGRPPPRLASWPAELAAIPALDDVAMGSGLLNVRPDGDGVVRRMPLAMRAGGKLRPSFSAEIARASLDADTIALTPTSVRIGRRSVPVDDEGRIHLRFGRFPDSLIVSAEDVLGDSARLPANLFEGKPVLVGVSADGTSDIAATPLAAEEFGPLVQAQAVDALLTGAWLSRPGWIAPAEWGLAAIVALLALGLAWLGRWYRWLLGFLFLAIPAISWLAFSGASLLFDPARPLLIGGGGVAGVALGLFALARIERERLREALIEQRLLAAETEGELQAARAIQLGMVPPHRRLARLDPRVDLDALLEPAKSVGGDFYDAMMLDRDRLGFAIADVTGKGVPAALYMAMAKTLTRAALTQMQVDPAGMADAINAELVKDNSEAMSVTMLLGILDLASGEVRLVCAGHEDPLLIPAKGEPRLVKLDGGPPFSITEYPYPLERVALAPGDILLLVTDGVTEAQDGAGALFGRTPLLHLPAAARTTATALCGAIRDSVRSFEGGTEATDDLTVMAVRFLGPAET